MTKKYLTGISALLLTACVFSGCQKEPAEAPVAETSVTRNKVTNAVVDVTEAPVEETEETTSETTVVPSGVGYVDENGYISITSAETTASVAESEVVTLPGPPPGYVPETYSEDVITPPIEWTNSLMSCTDKWDNLSNYRMIAVDLSLDGVPELILLDRDSDIEYKEMSMSNAYVYDINGNLITEYLDNEYSNFTKFIKSDGTEYWGYAIDNDYYKYQDGAIKKLAYLEYNDETYSYSYYVGGNTEVTEPEFNDYLVENFNYNEASVSDVPLMAEKAINAETHDKLEYFVRELMVRWYSFHV